MNNKNKYDLNEEQILQWVNNKERNPLTKRKIKINGPVYKKLKKCYKIYLENKENEETNDLVIDNYITNRRNKIDPILLIELPLLENMNDSDTFKFKYKWNPYTGKRSVIDINGPLYFDPDTLIHYFYINRLTGLWKPGHFENENGEDFWIEDMYGDCVGNGPDFNNNSRGGKQPEKYLFRLPIIDCYLRKDHFDQSITMGPILNDDEIKELYSLSKKYKNNYKLRFKKERPNLLLMKKWYEIAISKTPEKLTNYHIDGLEGEILNILREEINRNYVDLLRNY